METNLTTAVVLLLIGFALGTWFGSSKYGMWVRSWISNGQKQLERLEQAAADLKARMK